MFQGYRLTPPKFDGWFAAFFAVVRSLALLLERLLVGSADSVGDAEGSGDRDAGPAQRAFPTRGRSESSRLLPTRGGAALNRSTASANFVSNVTA